MMFGMRGAMIARKNVLPYDYAVEYLESSTSGAEYIDTGIVPVTGITYKVDLYARQNAGAIFGAYQGGSYLQISFSGNWCLYHSSPSNAYGAQFEINEQHHIELGPKGYFVDAEQKNAVIGTRPISARTVYLYNRSGGDMLARSLRIMKFVATNADGVDVCRLIPCVKEGVPCFYDDVSKTFKYSVGGGAFIAGPRI